MNSSLLLLIIIKVPVLPAFKAEGPPFLWASGILGLCKSSLLTVWTVGSEAVVRGVSKEDREPGEMPIQGALHLLMFIFIEGHLDI